MPVHLWRTQRVHSALRLVIAGLCLSLVIIGLSTLNPANAAQQTTLQGFLGIAHGDPAQGLNLPHQDYVYLIDVNHHSTLLLVDLASVESLVGKFVSVTGQATTTTQSQGPSALQVTTISAVTGGSAPQSIGLESVYGSQPWAALMCQYSDVAAQPKDTTYITNLLLGPYPSLNNFWVENSYNQVNILGSAVTPHWYTLPHPKSYYTDSKGGLQLGYVADDCTAVVANDPASTLNLLNFVGINMILNDKVDNYAWGGGWSVQIKGTWKSYRMTWLPPWGYENQGVTAHEIGHGFGLLHSSGPYKATYDSRWDVMSDIWDNCSPSDTNYGCVGSDTISYHKDYLGWIPAARKYVASPGTSATIVIERIDQPVATNDYLMAQIPIPNSYLFYTVEVRKKTGYVAGANAYDNSRIPGDAVVLHQVNPYRGDRLAQVVDVDNNGNPNDAGAMWEPGKTFTDVANKITVAVISVGPSSFTLTITNANVGGPTLTPTATKIPTNTPTPPPTSTPPPSPHVDTIGIYRGGTFYLKNTNVTGYADLTIPFNPAVKPYPIVGDWLGDHFDEIGVYDQTNGLFSLRNSNTPGSPDELVVLGVAGDQPLSGRWTAGAFNDGVGVFRPSNGLIYLKNALSTGYADYTMVLGLPGDVGIAGDWTGKGYDSPGVYRPSAITFYLSNQVTTGPVYADMTVILGLLGDVPIAGDWTAQGHDGIGVFRVSNGQIYMKNALTTGYADNSMVYGIAGDMPVAGHWTSNSRSPAPGLILPATLVPTTPTPSGVVPTPGAAGGFDG